MYSINRLIYYSAADQVHMQPTVKTEYVATLSNSIKALQNIPAVLVTLHKYRPRP